MRLDYWEREETQEMSEEEYINDNDELNIFVNAVNTAKELKKQNIITTRPLLSLEFSMESEENRKYHLWVTAKGEGYLQSLRPHENLTFQINSNSIEELKDFFATKEKVEILQGEIEFEH